MKLEQNVNGAWRCLLEFPSADLLDVQIAAMRLFSHGPQPQRLRIRDAHLVLYRTEQHHGLITWISNPIPATTPGETAA
jgi:hypothetical protein